MESDLTLLTGLLAAFWFLVYWVFGGVAFALLVLLRLGRVRKVRFSCLFTMLALGLGGAAAYEGVRYSEDAVGVCLEQAANRAQVVSAIFGCGGIGIVGAFALGIVGLFVGGFLLLTVCRWRNGHDAPPVADTPEHRGE